MYILGVCFLLEYLTIIIIIMIYKKTCYHVYFYCFIEKGQIGYIGLRCLYKTRKNGTFNLGYCG